MMENKKLEDMLPAAREKPTTEQIAEALRLAEECDGWLDDNVFWNDKDGEPVETLSYYKGIINAITWLQTGSGCPVDEEDLEELEKRLGDGTGDEEEDDEGTDGGLR